MHHVLPTYTRSTEHAPPPAPSGSFPSTPVLAVPPFCPTQRGCSNVWPTRSRIVSWKPTSGHVHSLREGRRRSRGSRSNNVGIPLVPTLWGSPLLGKRIWRKNGRAAKKTRSWWWEGRLHAHGCVAVSAGAAGSARTAAAAGERAARAVEPRPGHLRCTACDDDDTDDDTDDTEARCRRARPGYVPRLPLRPAQPSPAQPTPVLLQKNPFQRHSPHSNPALARRSADPQ